MTCLNCRLKADPPIRTESFMGEHGEFCSVKCLLERIEKTLPEGTVTERNIAKQIVRKDYNGLYLNCLSEPILEEQDDFYYLIEDIINDQFDMEIATHKYKPLYKPLLNGKDTVSLYLDFRIKRLDIIEEEFTVPVSIASRDCKLNVIICNIQAEKYPDHWKTYASIVIQCPPHGF